MSVCVICGEEADEICTNCDLPVCIKCVAAWGTDDDPDRVICKDCAEYV
jgi:hypothetical protein